MKINIDITNTVGFIYKITSPNKKVYIGQTIDLRNRRSHYRSNDFHKQNKLWNNCQFYKWNPIDSFEVIEQCLCGKNKCKLNEREIFWIKYYNSFKSGLNCNKGGFGNIGHKHSDETIHKMRMSKLGVKHTIDRNLRKSEYTIGRKHTTETKKLISETKRKNMNDETRNKIKIGLTGNKNGIGNSGSPRKILCINTGVEYPSIKTASKEMNVCVTDIILVCKGKKPKSKGLQFKYV